MRYLRWMGLMSSLLFVGVLGGLMAPLPSEAVPTLNIKIDGTTVLPTGQTSFLIASPTTCNTAEANSGYTQCYGIRTSTTAQYGATGRKYTVRNAPNSTARLRIAERVGQDKFSLVGVQFVPVAWSSPGAAANNNEQHVITIILVNAFDNATVNVNNAQTYVWALRTGGEFRAGPTTAGACGTPGQFTSDGLCDAVGDRVTFTGRGTFSPTLLNVNILNSSGANSQPLSFTVAGPHEDPILSYDGLTNATMGQVDPTYPRFICDLNGGAIVTGDVCRPTITQTMTVTLKGQDTFVLVGGEDMFGANCDEQLSAQQQRQLKFLAALVKILDWWEDHHPNARLRAFITSIELILVEANQPPSDPLCAGAKVVTIDMATAAAEDYRDFVEHGAVAADPAPQTGTIVIRKFADTNNVTDATFDFEVTGNEISNFSLTSNGSHADSRTFTGLTTGEGGGSRTIKEISFPPVHDSDGFDSVWRLDSVVCDGAVGQVEMLYEGVGESLDGVRLNYVNDNQTVTCSFDNHHTHDGVDSPFGHPHPGTIIID